MPSRLALLIALCFPCVVLGQNSSIPQLASRPNAAYTVYLNFGGFGFQGQWGDNSPYTPGFTPAYSVDSNPNTFNATEIANIRNVYARTAEKFAAFNVNVTTIDPAPVGLNDSQRQAFYDSQPRLMQTVIGGDGGWFPNAGGVSYLGTTQNSYGTSGNGGAGFGYKTNFVFSAMAPSNLQFLAEATTHEQGHGLQLDHQSLWSGNTFVAEYDSGTGTGVGSVAPTMGNSYTAQRGLWRVGATSSFNSSAAQNDAALLLTNTGIAGNGAGGFMDSGNGHTMATATTLPISGLTVNSSAAVGLITPLSSTPNPIGEMNYTTDFFKFAVTSRAASRFQVTVVSGTSTISTGIADPGATLNATIRILDSNGTILYTSNTGVLSETIVADLANGEYFLQIASAGGVTDSRGYTYFDMGSYFIVGSFSPVPEPAIVLTALAIISFGGRCYVRRNPAQI